MYRVLCWDGEELLVATRRTFKTIGEARAYARGIAPTRLPEIAGVWGLYEEPKDRQDVSPLTHCMACRRTSEHCSAEPCEAVREDRAEDFDQDAGFAHDEIEGDLRARVAQLEAIMREPHMNVRRACRVCSAPYVQQCACLELTK